MALAAPQANIENALRRALAALNVHETEQTIDIHNVLSTVGATLDGVNMQYMVDFLRRNAREIKILRILLCHLSDQAVDILRSYLEDCSNLKRLCLRNGRNLGNRKAGRLLSGLHGHPTLKEVVLDNFGLRGTRGGVILSDLMQNMPVLKRLRCASRSLGVQGARALQSAIRANQTLEVLVLPRCRLGDNGVRAIVDAMEGNTTIDVLAFHGNRITANDGLPHLTRFLQDSPVKYIALSNNPGLFDNEENTRLFSIALKSSNVATLVVTGCRLPGHAVTALFQAAALSNALQSLYANDNDRLEGQELEHLLEIIPTMRNIVHMAINLDFTNKAVLSACHLMITSVQHLYDANDKSIVDGPITDILERNHRIYCANQLLDSEPGHAIPAGLWANAMKCISRDNRGATAAFKILQEKLVVWWAPETLSKATDFAPAVPIIAPPAALTAAAAFMPGSNAMVKRSHTQTSTGDHDEETGEQSSPSSSSLEPWQKCPRLSSTGKESSNATASIAMMMMNDIDTTGIPSLTREELMEMIQQQRKIAEQADAIAKIATRAYNNMSTEGAEEEDRKQAASTKKG